MPDLEKVTLDLGQILYRAEEPIEYVYFPDYAMISIVANMVNGQSTEVGVIGNEGMTGFDVLMGADYSLNENIVQIPDGAFRVKTAVIRKNLIFAGHFTIHFCALPVSCYCRSVKRRSAIVCIRLKKDWRVGF